MNYHPKSLTLLIPFIAMLTSCIPLHSASAPPPDIESASFSATASGSITHHEYSQTLPPSLHPDPLSLPAAHIATTSLKRIPDDMLYVKLIPFLTHTEMAKVAATCKEYWKLLPASAKIKHYIATKILGIDLSRCDTTTRELLLSASSTLKANWESERYTHLIRHTKAISTELYTASRADIPLSDKIILWRHAILSGSTEALEYLIQYIADNPPQQPRLMRELAKLYSSRTRHTPKEAIEEAIERTFFSATAEIRPTAEFIALLCDQNMFCALAHISHLAGPMASLTTHITLKISSKERDGWILAVSKRDRRIMKRQALRNPLTTHGMQQAVRQTLEAAEVR